MRNRRDVGSVTRNMNSRPLFVTKDISNCYAAIQHEGKKNGRESERAANTRANAPITGDHLGVQSVRKTAVTKLEFSQ